MPFCGRGSKKDQLRELTYKENYEYEESRKEDSLP